MRTQLLFPTVMYTADLEPPEEVSLGMFEYFKKYYARNRNIYRQNRGGNITGDVTGDFQIASKQQFFWLNNQVLHHCYQYLTEFGVDTNLVNLYASKSWPVICDNNGGGVEKHNHPNSHLSVVFYLQSDMDVGGDLIVYIDDNHPTRTLPICTFIPQMNFLSVDYSAFKPIVNQLVIFPSRLWHEVIEYHGNMQRYSVTYDILITHKKGSLEDNEMGFIHPDSWVNLNGD